MNRQIAQYSIIRFQPFTETEEFANIGIVLYLPKSKELYFKLRSAKEYGRICQFFEPLDKKIYIHSLEIIQDELERLQSYGQEAGNNYVNFYDELIRVREDIIQYSHSRVLFTTNVKDTLDNLFYQYVHRSFAYKAGFEDVMQKRIKTLLEASSLNKAFTKGSIGNESIYNVVLPFVNKITNSAIKPIHFQHKQPNQLIEHGSMWLSKIQQLKRHDFIQPHQVLFAFQKPEQTQGVLFNAFNDIKEQIEEFGIIMSDINDTDHIMHFAQQTTK